MGITKDDIITCCPMCGEIFFVNLKNRKWKYCTKCETYIEISDVYKSKHSFDYYRQLSYKKYKNYFEWYNVFVNYELVFNNRFSYNKFIINKDSHHYYCPFCGKRQFENINVCCNCGIETNMVESKHTCFYYQQKSMAIYGDFEHFKDILFDEEISLNPQYNPDLKNIKPQPVQVEKNIPKCPTCGSTNIEKISTTSKVVGAAMFGLLSKTAKSQFKCKNCGYKW